MINLLCFKRNSFSLFLLLGVFSSCSTSKVIVVRHAEKAPAESGTMMSNDVLLSEAGNQRAGKLKTILQQEKIVAIYSTQTKRTVATVQPLSQFKNIPVQFYSHRDTLAAFIQKVKQHKKGSVVIVGHSNTVDDVVNQFLGRSELSDLPETEYDNLFELHRKGAKYTLQKKKF